MPVPRIAIVGRPNVGKSSLLNMLARNKVSIVDPTPGTTRDRVSALVELEHPDDSESRLRRTVEVTDTGGYGVYVAEGRRFNEVGADLSSLTKDIERQISEAVASADLVLFVIDTQAGVTPQDEQIARLLRERVLGGRRAGDLRIRVVANKCDGPRWEAHVFDAAALGFGDPIPVSAKSNYFRREFQDELYRAAEALEARAPAAPADDNTPGRGGVRLAIIGKRNAGKSSIVNALAGEQRVIVSEIAGTTRDAVDVRFEIDGRVFTIIDTAGLRKKKSFADRIEWFAYDRLQRSVERAGVVLLVIDATEPVSQVDQQLAMLCQAQHKPTVIVVNKWDLVEQARGERARKDARSVSGGRTDEAGPTPEKYEEYLRKELKGLPFAPISFVSAHDGSNLHETVALAIELHGQAGQRVGTGKLNRMVRQILATRGPASGLGTFVKAFYVAQVAEHPPTIALIVNRPELFTVNYQKFLLNRLRDHLPYPEVPIKLVIKGRSEAREDDLVAGVAQQRAEPGTRKAAGLGGRGRADGGGDFDLDDPAAFFDDDAAGLADDTDLVPGAERGGPARDAGNLVEGISAADLADDEELLAEIAGETAGQGPESDDDDEMTAELDDEMDGDGLAPQVTPEPLGSPPDARSAPAHGPTRRRGASAKKKATTKTKRKAPSKKSTARTTRASAKRTGPTTAKPKRPSTGVKQAKTGSTKANPVKKAGKRSPAAKRASTRPRGSG